MEISLHQVLASISDCLWSGEIDAGGQLVYRYFSPVVERITGRPPELFLTGPTAGGTPSTPRTASAWAQSLGRLRGGQASREEYRVVWPDGDERWVRESVQVTRGADGRVLRLDGVVADITDHKRAVDFDDLLLCWSALLRIPDTAAVLQQRFDHVLVDEYQDTNAVQADILAGMAGGAARITAVGDDAQAIYAFRNATQRNIFEFPARFSADVVLLEENHRSTPPLLDATNAVIAEARHRHAKTLWSRRLDGPRPLLLDCADEGDQSAAVCTRLLEHHDRGTPLRRQAVLFRTGHHSDLLELELTARRIPFVKYGGLRFLEAAHVKDLLCLLRLVENPADELAWFRVLQLLDGVGPTTARRLSGAGPSLVAADLPPSAADDGTALLSTLAAARAETLARAPAAQVEAVRRWLDPMVERRYPRPAARTADLEQLQGAAAGAPSLSRFLVDLTLDPPAVTGDLAGPPHLDDDVLTLSTIHSAKGGEWDVVHLIHVADGNIPSDMSTGDEDSIEEERRLLYVAMTRARDRLYCYMPLRYHHTRGHGDRHGYAQLSRFFTGPVLERMDREHTALASPREDGAVVHPQLAAVDDLVAALWD